MAAPTSMNCAISTSLNTTMPGAVDARRPAVQVPVEKSATKTLTINQDKTNFCIFSTGHLLSSVVSPLIFLFYINTIDYHLSKDLKPARYADDVAVSSALNACMKGIETSQKELKLTINQDKTNFCIFSTGHLLSSVVSPLIFLFYINTIDYHLSKDLKPARYADDVAVSSALNACMKGIETSQKSLSLLLIKIKPTSASSQLGIFSALCLARSFSLSTSIRSTTI
ncbi:hypothetical protein TNCV_736601 [Trichonephila clavipes]|nr:hypothetical protein TNCV_736601 [Trichonephila clavipes]